LFIIIGTIIALNQSINHKLKIFDQITFQREISHFHSKAEIAETANSGAEVHNATIVNHIIISDIFRVLAIFTLDHIKELAEYHKTKSPTTKITIDKIIKNNKKIKYYFYNNKFF